MRLIHPCFLLLILAPAAVSAQSISENLPDMGGGSVYVAPDAAIPPPPVVQTPSAVTTDPYTVTDVNADVTADTAAHARDQALMQAERAAFVQLVARSGGAEGVSKLSDDAIAAMVQSFEVQSERLSAVRYIGVFTIRFKPAAVQKRIGKYLGGSTDLVSGVGAGGTTDDAKPMPAGTISHLPVAVPVDSIAAWTQIKRRLSAVPQIARVDTIDLGRGLGHLDLSYGGSIDDLENAVTTQGFVLRQDSSGNWNLTDSSMVPR